jgi:hypothetical protein
MKYRKKPVVIEAVQFLDTTESIEGLANFIDHTVRIGYATKPPTISICTLEGVMEANEGDFIIKGVNGEFYACKPDIFDKTYEMVDDEPDICEKCIENKWHEENGHCEHCKLDILDKTWEIGRSK